MGFSVYSGKWEVDGLARVDRSGLRDQEIEVLK